GTWRQTYRTRESTIAALLVEACERWPGVLIGSYPMFPLDGPQVEVVVKSSDAGALAAASDWLSLAIEQRSRREIERGDREREEDCRERAEEGEHEGEEIHRHTRRVRAVVGAQRRVGLRVA